MKCIKYVHKMTMSIKKKHRIIIIQKHTCTCKSFFRKLIFIILSPVSEFNPLMLNVCASK